MAAAPANSTSNDRSRAIPSSPGTPGHDEEYARSELEARNATEAIAQARRKSEADQAALARLEAETDLPASATDAQIEDHLLATGVARVRARQSKKVLEAAEQAGKLAIEQAAAKARIAGLRQALEEQDELIERFRAEYPEAMSKLLRLFAEAYAVEITGGKFNKDRAEDEETYISVFRFGSLSPPFAIRVQVLDRSSEIIWQGDQNSDVGSYIG